MPGIASTSTAAEAVAEAVRCARRSSASASYPAE
jgi:hypothetical protein